MPSLQSTAAASPHLLFAETPFDGPLLLKHLTTASASMRFHPSVGQQITKTFAYLCAALDGCVGLTLQERWQDFEQRIWPVWLAGQDRPPGKWGTGAVRIAVNARLVHPGVDCLCTTYTANRIERLSEDNP